MSEAEKSKAAGENLPFQFPEQEGMFYGNFWIQICFTFSTSGT